METIVITVAGHVNTGKSTLARLILKTLADKGISARLSQNEIDEGYDIDSFESITGVLQSKINVLIDTKQFNRNAIVE